jgi:hypothetical protein
MSEELFVIDRPSWIHPGRKQLVLTAGNAGPVCFCITCRWEQEQCPFRYLSVGLFSNVSVPIQHGDVYKQSFYGQVIYMVIEQVGVYRTHFKVNYVGPELNYTLVSCEMTLELEKLKWQYILHCRTELLLVFTHLGFCHNLRRHLIKFILE